MLKLTVRQHKSLKDQTVSYHAAVATTTPVMLETVTADIERMCTVNSADIKAVLDALQTVILTRIKNGQSVRLGDLGSFRPTISSGSQDAPEKVTVADVRAVRCRFTQSGRISRELSKKNVPMAIELPVQPEAGIAEAAA